MIVGVFFVKISTGVERADLLLLVVSIGEDWPDKLLGFFLFKGDSSREDRSLSWPSSSDDLGQYLLGKEELFHVFSFFLWPLPLVLLSLCETEEFISAFFSAAHADIRSSKKQ